MKNSSVSLLLAFSTLVAQVHCGQAVQESPEEIGQVAQALGAFECRGYTSGGGQRVIGSFEETCYSTFEWPGAAVTHAELKASARNQKQNIGWNDKRTTQLRIVGTLDVQAQTDDGMHVVDFGTNGELETSIETNIWEFPPARYALCPTLGWTADLTYFGRDGTRCSIVGTNTSLRGAPWANVSSAGALGDDLFIIDGQHLYRVERTSGARTDLGTDWSGPTQMTAAEGTLYVIQNNVLLLVDPASGAWQQLGSASWEGSSSMAAVADQLFVIQYDHLYRVDPHSGGWTDLGTDWSGPTQMAAIGQSLYIIQAGYLLQVDPQTGAWLALGEPIWANATSMAAVGDNLFVVGGDNLYRVDRSTGDAAALGLSDVWFGPTRLAAAGGKLYAIQGQHLFEVDANSGRRTPLDP